MTAHPPTGSGNSAGLSVVHLVRAANGEAPFRAFLDALETAPPGIESWELVLAMKGFADRGEAERYASLASHLEPRLLLFEDSGLDLTVYFAVAEQLHRDRYCFLNSYSQPLVEGWLAHLDAALAEPGAGIVGATGSWASTLSGHLYRLFLPSAYNGVLPPRRVVQEQLRTIEREVGGADLDLEQSPPAVFVRKLRRLTRLPGEMIPFERFPAHHVRTNAFMISGATLARLRLRPVQTKRDAYLLEHGRRSLTRQVERLGLRALLVDCEGSTYETSEWDRSLTFWQGEQEGLLVADNQTRRYADGDAERRSLLSSLAWGRKARPALPSVASTERTA